MGQGSRIEDGKTSTQKQQSPEGPMKPERGSLMASKQRDTAVAAAVAAAGLWPLGLQQPRQNKYGDGNERQEQ